MNYLIKCAVQHVLSRIPKGERINLWLQIKGTKNLPVNEEVLKNKIEIAKIHLDNFKKYNKNGIKDYKEISSFEFGAGYDLIAPLIFSFYGLKAIYCVDIEDKASAFLINDIIKRLAVNEEFTGINSSSYNEDEFLNGDYKNILKNNYNLHYIAPMDAAKTNFENESFDLIATNATMEHIPENSLKNILKEAHRILKPGGVFSNVIDYKDHWAYVDSKLSYYNFLKYSEKKWRLLNPALNYQNRLRHKDYIELFKSAGFEITYVLPRYPTEKETDSLNRLKLHSTIKNNYTMDETAILSSFIVVTKK